MIVAVILQLISGVGSALAPEYWSFTLLRMVVGASLSGTMVLGYVLLVEVTGKEYRQTMSALYQLPLNVGHLMLPGFAYFLRDWTSLQLALALPSVLFLSFICFLDESPRWLLATGQTEKAIPIIIKAANMYDHLTLLLPYNVYILSSPYYITLDLKNKIEGEKKNLLR